MTTPATARARDTALPRLTFGPGAVDGLCDIATRLADGRPLLVLAGRSSARRRWLAGLLGRLPGHVFATLPGQYPTWESVDRLVGLMGTLGTGATIAIGGGSVLDTAKIAASRADERHGGARRPVVAVPTTPGTGAEVTPFATVWDFAGLRKYSYYRPNLAPDIAVVDPDLIRTLVRDQLGSAVLDTLAQGMEAVWSTGSTSASRAHGLGAVSLAAGNLPRLLADPWDEAARSALSLAGLRSGMAIATSRTTICHALSYPLTLHYGVRHGHACGLTLGGVLSYNAEVTAADCQDPRGVGHVRTVIDRLLEALCCDTPDEAAELLDGLAAAAGLSAYRDGRFDDGLLATEALSYDRADNNPRRFDRDRLTSLLASLR